MSATFSVRDRVVVGPWGHRGTVTEVDEPYQTVWVKLDGSRPGVGSGEWSWSGVRLLDVIERLGELA